MSTDDLQAPAWFTRAIETPCSEHEVTVGGCPIRFLTWGDPAKPGVVLVHGNGAHARWWSFIAPFLTTDYYVAAPNLSGMGDSGHRDRYAPEQFVDEIKAIGPAAGMRARPIVIGHSFGGFMTLLAGSHHPDELAGIVMADSPIRPPDVERRRHWRTPSGKKRIYPNFESGLARFRLMPEQPCDNRYIMDYVGRHSLTETAEGWTWKFDSTAFMEGAFRIAYRDHIRNLRCRLAILYGSDSALFLPEYARYIAELTDHKVPMIEIPEAHHHVMLDQPLALVAALRTLLADWGHSEPHRFAPETATPPPIETDSPARDGEDAA